MLTSYEGFSDIPGPYWSVKDTAWTNWSDIPGRLRKLAAPAMIEFAGSSAWALVRHGARHQQLIVAPRSVLLKTAVFVVLAVLCALGAVMLYWAPVRGYAIACERTTDLACVLERTGASGTRRSLVPLPGGAEAVVRILPRRRGASRVTLEIRTPDQSIFAAEFEGAGADTAADAAAAQLNTVFRARTAPARARITVAPPPVYRIAAWSGLGVMGLIILAGVRGSSARRR